MSPRERRKKSVYLFALHAGLLLLALAWLPGPRQAYPAAFHAQANLLFDLIGGERVVRLSVPTESLDGSDTKMAGYQRGRFEPRFVAMYRISERGYWPLLVVVASVIATPLPLLRRLGALMVGALLMNAFTLLQVALLAFVSFRVADAGPDSAGWQHAATAAAGIFNSELPRVVAVLLMWTLVARPGETLDTGSLRLALGRLLGRGPGAGA